jgi:hypothetical protein
MAQLVSLQLRSTNPRNGTNTCVLAAVVIALATTSVALWGVSSDSQKLTNKHLAPLNPLEIAELREMFNALTDGMREHDSDLNRDHLLIASPPEEIDELFHDDFTEIVGLSNLRTAVAIRLHRREKWRWSDVLSDREIIERVDDMVPMMTSTGQPAIQLSVSRPIRNGDDLAAFLVTATNARTFWTINIVLLKRLDGAWKPVRVSLVGYY